MPSTLAVDRSHLCSFTFPTGRKCRMPLFRNHPYFCTFHAHKDAKARAIEQVGKDIAFDFSGRYVSSCDFSSALARCITAVAQRTMTPRAATSIAYLSQTLLQSIRNSESEYVRTFGVDAWKHQVSGNFNTPRPPDSDNQTDDPENDDADPDDAAIDCEPARESEPVLAPRE